MSGVHACGVCLSVHVCMVYVCVCDGNGKIVRESYVACKYEYFHPTCVLCSKAGERVSD